MQALHIPASAQRRYSAGALAAAILTAALGTCLLAGCKPSATSKDAQKEAQVLSLGAEDILVMGRGGAGQGVAITGSLQAERRADLRAEVGSVVLRVMRDNGETARRGDLLVKLDDTAIKDSLSSAEEAVRASGQSAEGAERQYQRLKALQAQGMTSLQAMEDAEVRRNVAQSELVAAQARVASARQQLERTEVRAPFDGVVSARKVSAGDTAGIGKELIQVIDPSSLRFDGLVAAEQVAALRVGQTVAIRVQGREGQPLLGRLRRIDAVAQPVTRQVAVIVEFGAEGGRLPQGLIPGLYAEGTVEVPVTKVLALPETAVMRDGEKAFVWRLVDGAVQRQAVEVKPRDVRTGLVVVGAGLSMGDQVLRSPGSKLTEGQRFTLRDGQTASDASAATGAATRTGG